VALQHHKTIVISGLRGQDGSYLAEYLTERGHRVIGTSQEQSGEYRLPFSGKIVELIKVDISSYDAIRNVVKEAQPDEIYNLAARSSSAQLFDDPLATVDINAVATARWLEAIKTVRPSVRFCQACSSEIFANARSSPQNEDAQIYPVNAYGAAKAYGLHIVDAYKATHQLFATTAILFNHESPLRSVDYVTRKITSTVAKIALGRADKLVLGSLDVSRDWGHAKDYVLAMYLMLQHATPHNFVIGTGVSRTLREFCAAAFDYVGLDYQHYVKLDATLLRRNESVTLCADPAKALRLLGWQAQTSFSQLVHEMVEADLLREKIL
jgi:GDPmannose 4,6-dehydratase